MMHTPTENLLTCAPLWGAGGEENAKVRDRVLLYARGLEVPIMISLELALESMRRASLRQPEGAPGMAVAAAMEELHSLLRKNGISLKLSDAGGGRLASAPPLCRRYMISEGLEVSFPLLSLKKLVRFLGRTHTG